MTGKEAEKRCSFHTVKAVGSREKGWSSSGAHSLTVDFEARVQLEWSLREVMLVA